LTTVEEVFLKNGPFIGGERLGMADVHVVWVLRWVLVGRLSCAGLEIGNLEDSNADNVVRQDWELRSASRAWTRRLSLKSGT